MFQCAYLYLLLCVESQYAGSPFRGFAQSLDADAGLHTESDQWVDARTRCQEEGYTLEPRTGSCYKFHGAPRTWYQAYVACHEEDGELAVINSENEAQVLKEMFMTLSTEEAIIGFRSKEGEWVTIEGQSLADAGFDSWAPGEPNNRRGNEMCGFMLRSGLLNDDPCDKLSPYICEIEL